MAKDGKRYTTEEQKPVKREIDDESDESFFRACRDTILTIIAKKTTHKQQQME